LHNPEFTLLEWYRTGAAYDEMMTDTEGMVLAIAHELGKGESIKYHETL